MDTSMKRGQSCDLEKTEDAEKKTFTTPAARQVE